MARCPIAVCGLALALGCSLSSSAPAVVELQLRAVAGYGEVGLVAEDDRGATLTIEAARLEVAELAVQLPDGERCSDLEDVECDGDRWVLVPGPFDVDLIAGISAGPVTLPHGTYRRAMARLVRPAEEMDADGAEGEEDDGGEADPEPPPAFSAAGTVESVTTRVEIGLVPADITFSGPSDIIAGETEATLVLGLDVSTWMTGVSIRDCILGHDPEEGPFEIDETTMGIDACTAGLADTVRSNVESSGRLVAAQ